jgi:hypothetical protein
MPGEAAADDADAVGNDLYILQCESISTHDAQLKSYAPTKSYRTPAGQLKRQKSILMIPESPESNRNNDLASMSE